MKEAIPKLDRRLTELSAFDVETIESGSDPAIKALETKLVLLLTNIFGSDTVEFERYHFTFTTLDTTTYNYMYEVGVFEVRKGVKAGIDTAASVLRTIRDHFAEEVEDTGPGTGTSSLKAYEGLDLHPIIGRAAGDLFRDGHYANAIEDSVKALNNLVRLYSGVEDRDGTALMEFVFTPKNPILAFNPLADQSDLDEQKGFMMMFSGAVAGLRNPRAHKLIKDDAERALEFIAFVSLLAKLAESAKKKRPA